jgi:hypothetical protein
MARQMGKQQGEWKDRKGKGKGKDKEEKEGEEKD